MSLRSTAKADVSDELRVTTNGAARVVTINGRQARIIDAALGRKLRDVLYEGIC
jgi:hypothetical protein